MHFLIHDIPTATNFDRNQIKLKSDVELFPLFSSSVRRAGPGPARKDEGNSKYLACSSRSYIAEKLFFSGARSLINCSTNSWVINKISPAHSSPLTPKQYIVQSSEISTFPQRKLYSNGRIISIEICANDLDIQRISTAPKVRADDPNIFRAVETR